MQCWGQNMNISSTIVNISDPDLFDILMRLNYSQYCITGLMYYNMAICRYIVTSLIGSIEWLSLLNTLHKELTISLLLTGGV